MTLTIIFLSVLLVIVILFNWIEVRTTHNLFIENRTLKWQYNLTRRANMDENPVYTTVKGFGKHDDAICVIRVSIQDKQTHNTLIKAFSDEDENFNIREAEELLELLNSK